MSKNNRQGKTYARFFEYLADKYSIPYEVACAIWARRLVAKTPAEFKAVTTRRAQDLIDRKVGIDNKILFYAMCERVVEKMSVKDYERLLNEEVKK